MEPVQGSTSGHMQLDIILTHPPVHALVVEYLPPAFVGSDYYCEAGYNILWQSVLYSNDTLWDGQDCDGLEHACCDLPNLLWFCRELSEPTSDDLEFRLCGDEPRNNEDIPIDLVELYIQ